MRDYESIATALREDIAKALAQLRERDAEIARLREERRLREALWQASANETRLVYGGVFRPPPLSPEAA